MGTDSKTYSGISRSGFNALRAELKRAKVDLPSGDQGTLSSHGLTGSFAFDPDAETLQLSIVKYPMLVPRSMIWKAVDDAIGKVRSG